VAVLDAGVGGGEVPVDLALVDIGLVLPVGVEGVEVVDAAVQALRDRAESSISEMLSQGKPLICDRSGSSAGTEMRLRGSDCLVAISGGAHRTSRRSVRLLL
jgi:hypothetical protein